MTLKVVWNGTSQNSVNLVWMHAYRKLYMILMTQTCKTYHDKDDDQARKKKLDKQPNELQKQIKACDAQILEIKPARKDLQNTEDLHEMKKYDKPALILPNFSLISLLI